MKSAELMNMAKLQWACRRGMLELDVLLDNFLKEAYLGLPEKDKQLFVELLSTEDPLLLDWLMGRDVPVEQGMAHIVSIIRSHARPNL